MMDGQKPLDEMTAKELGEAMALEWLQGNGLEDDLMSGIKRLADREAFLNTDTAKPGSDLIIEDVGPKK